MGALTGVRVVDLSRFVAGPFCCQILGDHGADVIKVEKANGEPARRMPPFFKDESLYFLAYNGSKRSVALNFRSVAGMDVLRQLIAKADVVVENFRADTMDKMGLGYRALAQTHPGLILVSISGFGTEGPYADRPAFDEIIQTMSGLTSLTGEADGPPRLTGTYVADFLTGVYAALGTVLALQARARSGRGQWVRMNLLQCLVSILNTTVNRYLTLGEAPQRHGNRNPLIAPGNLYKAQDGYVTIECLTQDMWEDLARAMGRDDLLRDPRFADVVRRSAHAEALDQEIEKWMQDKAVETVLTVLHRHGVASGPVLDIPALVTHPQFAANGTVTRVEMPGLGEIPLLAPPIHMDGDAQPRRGRPPRQGEHTGDVLGEWLGLTASDVARLREAAAL
ncbi:MAG TPA: CoA transferase [Candidatus Sulfotelmatobacter sp.]|nr:CoA transferase [Candidatus Sulfotelmatobacter sp.]